MPNDVGNIALAESASKNTNPDNSPAVAGLTKKQSALLRFIRGYHRLHGMAPSYREMMEHTGQRSLGGIHGMMQALIRRGHITAIPGVGRSIKPVGSGVSVRQAAETLMDTCDLSDTTRAELTALIGGDA